MDGPKKYRKLTPNPEIILKNYSLCDHCLGRFFAKKLGVSSYRLGKKIRKELGVSSSDSCYICKDLHQLLDVFAHHIMKKISGIEFCSLLIGTKIKPSIIDRDDYLRSKFKLRGIDSIKTSITRELSKKLSRRTHVKIDPLSPDLTIIINLKTNDVDIKKKPVILCGRYIKKTRYLPQRQKKCQNCYGKGCHICLFHGITGFGSVEGIISKFLYEKLGTQQVKFSWIGGEDESSLVLGNGRLFFAKALNPNLRNQRFSKKIDLKDIVIFGLKKIEIIPPRPVPFKSSIHLEITTKEEMTSGDLKNLKKLKKSVIKIYEKPNKTLEKIIHSVSYKKKSKNSFLLLISAEGGFPVKRFVEGPDVEPNLSDFLGKTCTCNFFDFYEIEL